MRTKKKKSSALNKNFSDPITRKTTPIISSPDTTNNFSPQNQQTQQNVLTFVLETENWEQWNYVECHQRTIPFKTAFSSKRPERNAPIEKKLYGELPELEITAQFTLDIRLVIRTFQHQKIRTQNINKKNNCCQYVYCNN